MRYARTVEARQRAIESGELFLQNVKALCPTTFKFNRVLYRLLRPIEREREDKIGFSFLSKVQSQCPQTYRLGRQEK